MGRKGALSLSVITGIGGIIVGYFMAKRKYEEYSEEQIKNCKEALKAHYEGKEEEKKAENSPGEKSPEKPTGGKYNYASRAKKPVDTGTPNVKIESIKPTEYEEDFSYETAELIFYEKNDIVVDHTGKVLNPSDIASSIGLNFKKYIGIYERDSAYFKNDTLKTYYCVIVDDDVDYLEKIKTSPHLQEVVDE